MNEYIDIILRSLAVYAFMLVAIRLTGKKELSQLNTTDVVLILLISNAVQNAMVGNNTSLLGGLIAAAVLFALNFLLKKLMFRSKRFRDLISQQPEILVHNGNLDFTKLSKLGITNDELQEAMREHGVERYKDVKLAILEVDGNISIISGDENLRHTQYHRKKKHKSLGDLN
ncbi:MAG: YetF domain-containing protein [Bacteroidota bacterium]